MNNEINSFYNKQKNKVKNFPKISYNQTFSTKNFNSFNKNILAKSDNSDKLKTFNFEDKTRKKECKDIVNEETCISFSPSDPNKRCIQEIYAKNNIKHAICMTNMLHLKMRRNAKLFKKLSIQNALSILIHKSV